MITKSDYKRPNPSLPFEKFGQWGAPSKPYGASPGYQPIPYSPYPTGQGYDLYSTGQPDPNYGTSSYQPVPTYNPQTGYQSDRNQYYNYPNPAYSAGYQPTPYTQMPTPGTACQQKSYYPGQYPSQPSFAPQTQYSYTLPQSQPYGLPQSQPYGWSAGAPSQYPNTAGQPSYPYGQGEAMQQSQSSSLSMAAPVSMNKTKTEWLPAELTLLTVYQ